MLSENDSTVLRYKLFFITYSTDLTYASFIVNFTLWKSNYLTDFTFRVDALQLKLSLIHQVLNSVSSLIQLKSGLI